MAHDYHLVHYGQRATQGFGGIIVEVTSVEERGVISPADLGLWRDEQMPPLKRLVDFCKGQGTCMGIQIGHAGRKAFGFDPRKGGRSVDTALHREDVKVGG